MIYICYIFTYDIFRVMQIKQIHININKLLYFILFLKKCFNYSSDNNDDLIFNLFLFPSSIFLHYSSLRALSHTLLF